MSPFQCHIWQRDPLIPILPPGPNDFDRTACMNPFVLRRSDEYGMYCAGADAKGNRRVCLATAPVGNLTGWKPLGPLFDLGPKGSFDTEWCVVPWMHRFATRWHLYYPERSGDPNAGLQGFRDIGLAVSDDGLRWERGAPGQEHCFAANGRRMGKQDDGVSECD